MDVIQTLAWYSVFLFSVTLHEFSHAWMAKRGGDLTAYHGGQVTLNPWPHIRREPLGMVVFPIISSFLFGWPFGYASAPYDPFWAARHPRRAAWMALAGPASNLLLVLVASVCIRLGILAGWFAAPETVNFTQVTEAIGPGFFAAVAYLLSMIFTLNLVLTLFNILPLPPFDGGEAIVLVLSEEAARKYQAVTKNPSFGFIGFLLAWQVFSPIFHFVFLFALNLLYPGSGYA
jgi:Zn-dependent protease